MSINREHWSSRLSFILAAAGSAIGLGTMWMLPYVIGQNGGGAFILLFLAFIILIGIPLFICELALGRQTQRGVVGSFERFSHADSSWKLVGWIGVITTYLIAGFYTVIAGWGLNYCLMSLTDTFAGLTPAEVSEHFTLFRKSGGLNILWQTILLLLAVGIVIKGVAKGIEYWSKILTSGLFILLIVLAIYSSTLSGFSQAVEYLLIPNFALLNSASVLKALALSLFALSLGEGIMITYGSYMSPKDDLPRNAIIVGISIIFIAVLVALMIFPMVFTFGFAPTEGEGLLFKILPYVFEQLPGSIILSFTFFTLLTFAAITSSIGQLEVIVANHIDMHKWSRQKATIVAAIFTFLIGLPTALALSDTPIFPNWEAIFQRSFLDTCYVVIDWLLCIFALATTIFLGWKMPKAITKTAFTTGSALKFLFPLWYFLIRWIVPAAICLVILQHAKLINMASWF